MSMLSNQCKKSSGDRANEDCSGAYLTQADNESDSEADLSDDEVAELPEDFKKKLDKAKALESMTNNLVPTVEEKTTKTMKSNVALSPQERQHVRRTQGQAVGTDKLKDG